MVYSALNASMGRILAALRAGMSPASVPASTMTSVASTQTSSPTVGLTNIAAVNMPESIYVWPIVASIYALAAMPANMPI